MPALPAAPPPALTPLQRQSVLRTLRSPRLLGTEVLAAVVVALWLIAQRVRAGRRGGRGASMAA